MMDRSVDNASILHQGTDTHEALVSKLANIFEFPSLSIACFTPASEDTIVRVSVNISKHQSEINLMRS